MDSLTRFVTPSAGEITMMQKHPGSHRMLGLAAVGMLALAGCATTSPNYGSSYPSSSQYPYPSQASCMDCGLVTRIDVVPSGRSAPSATGAILGGIVGAVAGHEISDKTGGSKGNQNVAAVAGAAAGAMAGNAIQKRATGDTYNVHVRMDDGRTVVINQHDLGGGRENTYVRVVNGKVVLR
jgi:outer membrane lipoprotein SlyB